MRRKEDARSLRKFSESGVASLCRWSYYPVLHLMIEYWSPWIRCRLERLKLDARYGVCACYSEAPRRTDLEAFVFWILWSRSRNVQWIFLCIFWLQQARLFESLFCIYILCSFGCLFTILFTGQPIEHDDDDRSFILSILVFIVKIFESIVVFQGVLMVLNWCDVGNILW